MAKQTLPTNFKDDIMNASMNGKRKYNLIQNTDGTVSLEDVTTYDQVGSNFGQAQINATNTAVNESADKNKILDSLDEIAANTQPEYIAGALAVSSLNSKMVKTKRITVNLSGWGIFDLGLNASEHIFVSAECHSSSKGYTVIPLNVPNNNIYGVIYDFSESEVRVKTGTHEIVVNYFDRLL